MFKSHRHLPAFLLSAGLLVAAPACASSGYYHQRNDYYREVERRAYDNGYREGVKHGEDDARHGRGFSLERNDDWRDADEGYHRGDGDRDVYRRSFRQGFQTGYNESFNRFARGGYVTPREAVPYPAPGYRSGAYGYGSPAVQNGYRDGLEAGRDDARDRRSFDPVRSRRYGSADHDYDRRYGSRDEYKRAYRDGFQRGYEEGYREFRGR